MPVAIKDVCQFIQHYKLYYRDLIDFLLVLDKVETGEEKEAIIKHFVDAVCNHYKPGINERAIWVEHYQRMHQYALICIDYAERNRRMEAVVQEAKSRRAPQKQNR